MSMDPICMLLRHGICSWDMVYAVWTWYMLLEDGICCMDMEDVLLLEKNKCAVHTVHVLYLQYMYQSLIHI